MPARPNPLTFLESVPMIHPCTSFKSVRRHARGAPLLALLASGLCVAGEANDSATDLGKTTVRGEATSRPELQEDSPLNPFRTTASSTGNVQTITREEIERARPTDVFDLLSNATGVLATQGSRKGFSGLMIRGDSNFRWIVDGAYLQPTMASRILKALPVQIIEQVKIVRGASALTMGPMVGSASPGGAPVDGFVIISTRRPEAAELQGRVAIESYNTTQAGAWAGKAFESGSTRSYIAGLGSYAHTDGPKDTLDNGATYNASRSTTSGMLKGGLSFGGWSVDLMAYSDTGKFDVPNANSHGSGQGSWYMDPSKTDLYVLTGSKSWNAANGTVLSASRSLSHQTFWTANTAAGPYTSVLNDNATNHVNLRHSIDFRNTRIMLGGDYMHWDTPNGQQYYEGIQREEVTRGWFAQLEQSLLANRLSLDASYRRDRVHVLHGLDYYTGGAQPFGGVSSPLRTTDKMLPDASFLSAGAAYRLNARWSLSGRYGQSSQPGDTLNPVPGVVLEADRQRKLEVGIESRISPALAGSLNYFHRAVQNEKSLSGYTYVATNGSTQVCRTAAIPTTGTLSPRTAAAITPCYTQSDTTMDGLELALSGTVHKQLGYKASWTHFTKLESSVTDIAATKPRDIGELSANYDAGTWYANGSIKRVSEYKGSATDAAAWLGGYTRVDLGAGRHFDIGRAVLQTTVYGRNLGDSRYETTNGIQDVGRVFGVELQAVY